MPRLAFVSKKEPTNALMSIFGKEKGARHRLDTGTECLFYFFFLIFLIIQLRASLIKKIEHHLIITPPHYSALFFLFH